MTSTRAINAAAAVIHACIQQGKTLPATQAYALDSAGLLNSPEHAAEVEQLRNDLTGACLARWEEEQDTARLRLALQSARRRALRRQPHVREGLIFRLEQDNKQLHAFVAIANEAARVQRQAWEGAQAELESLRARVAELEAAAGDGSTRTADEDPIRYSLTPEALHASSGAVIETPTRPEDVSEQVSQLRGLLARQRAAVEEPRVDPIGLHHDYRIPHDLPEVQA